MRHSELALYWQRACSLVLGAAMLLHGTNFLAKRVEVEADGTTTDD